MINFLQNRSSEKGAITPMAAFFITAVAAIFLLAYWMQGYPRTAVPTNPPVVCSQETKLCPDGSAVGRTGPNCEFAACPETSLTPTASASPVSSINTSNWKTYRNEEYGFEMKYPSAWKFKGFIEGMASGGFEISPIENIFSTIGVVIVNSYSINGVNYPVTQERLTEQVDGFKKSVTGFNEEQFLIGGISGV